MASALKDVTGWGNCVRSICIMPAATVANVAAPTLATDGIAVLPVANLDGENTLCFPNVPSQAATLAVKATVTAGQTLVGTLTLWGYHPGLAAWVEIPANGGTAVTAVALAETDTDVITFFQTFANLGHWKRLALQLSAIGGTGASFEAWLTTTPEAY